MKMNQKGKGNDEFCTPKYIFNQLDMQFNFTLDVACTKANCLVPIGLESNWNGLERSWSCNRVFCNCPFSTKAEWMKKAHEEVSQGDCPLCVMILPSNCIDSRAFHEYVIKPGYHFEILEGRISFELNGIPKKGNNSGTIIVYFKKKIRIKWG